MDYPLTELQLAILDVLWERGEATVMEIHDELRERRRVAQSTIATLLARLEKKGYVGYREDGRRYVYRATADRESVRDSLAAGFLEHARPLFHDDMGLLVSHLLTQREVRPDELDEARAILEDLARRLEEGDG